jgi:hypothetical protein
MLDFMDQSLCKGKVSPVVVSRSSGTTGEFRQVGIGGKVNAIFSTVIAGKTSLSIASRHFYYGAFHERHLTSSLGGYAASLASSVAQASPSGAFFSALVFRSAQLAENPLLMYSARQTVGIE